MSNLVSKLLGQKGSPTLPSYHSVSDLARKFNDFFVAKITNIRQQLISSQDRPHGDEQCASSLSTWSKVTAEEMGKIISKSPKKSCPLDPIPTWMLSKSYEVLLPVITNIINLSLESGFVPPNLKTALVTPILKKACLDPDLLKNYRHVSHLSFVSK